MGARESRGVRLAVALSGALTLGSAAAEVDVSGPEAILLGTETAFARTMADRDLDGFAAFLSDEVIFLGDDAPLRGRAAVLSAWAPYFEALDAPFSWQPEVALVLASGDLGLTSGPVRNPDGDVIATFNSVWRREPDGSWRIVFDRGCAH